MGLKAGQFIKISSRAISFRAFSMPFNINGVDKKCL